MSLLGAAVKASAMHLRWIRCWVSLEGVGWSGAAEGTVWLVFRSMVCSADDGFVAQKKKGGRRGPPLTRVKCEVSLTVKRSTSLQTVISDKYVLF